MNLLGSWLGFLFLIMGYKNPFKLGAGFPVKMVSFSMNFVFSMLKGNGDGLVFMMFLVGLL